MTQGLDLLSIKKISIHRSGFKNPRLSLAISFFQTSKKEISVRHSRLPISCKLARQLTSLWKIPNRYKKPGFFFLSVRLDKEHRTVKPAALHKKNVGSCLSKSYHSSNDLFSSFLGSGIMDFSDLLLTNRTL